MKFSKVLLKGMKDEFHERKKRGRYAGCSDLLLSPFALVEAPLKVTLSL